MNSTNKVEISGWLINDNLKQFETEHAENFEEANLNLNHITNYIEINAATLAAGKEKILRK